MPYSLIYNDGTTTSTYYYITNLQGDVMYLVDASGNEVAAYDYAPYGKVINITGALAEINPLRYRGYYYDSETGFYYLQSRYYDPEICRFINTDSYASTGQGFIGYNMFAYCNDNPVSLSDTSGSIPAYSLMLTDSGGGSRNRYVQKKNTFLGKVFGAGASSVYQTKYEEECASKYISPVISVKKGEKRNTILSSHGDSSKPISVYAQGRADNELLSSAGLKINIGNFSLNFSLGLDDLGISASVNKGNAIESIAMTADLEQFKVGLEQSATVWDKNSSITDYTNISVSGWILVATYIFIETGEWQPTPYPYSYGY